MKTIITNPKSAAILCVILCLPITILLSLLWLNIEHPLGHLLNASNNQPDVLGSLIVLGLALFLPVALVIDLAPVMQDVCAGNGITAHPSNLLLAVVILLFIAMIVGGIIVDQYPCWIGVPNCD